MQDIIVLKSNIFLLDSQQKPWLTRTLSLQPIEPYGAYLPNDARLTNAINQDASSSSAGSGSLRAAADAPTGARGHRNNAADDQTMQQQHYSIHSDKMMPLKATAGQLVELVAAGSQQQQHQLATIGSGAATSSGASATSGASQSTQTTTTTMSGSSSSGQQQQATGASMQQQNTIQHTIHELEPITRYSLRIVAVNSIGRSRPSVALSVRTDEEGKSAP